MQQMIVEMIMRGRNRAIRWILLTFLKCCSLVPKPGIETGIPVWRSVEW